MQFSTDQWDLVSKNIGRMNHVDDVQRVSLCEQDFVKFAETYLPHMFSITMSDFHRKFMKIISSEETEKRINLTAPRSHGKTTMIVAFMTFLLMYGFGEFILFVAANDSYAIDKVEMVLAEVENNQLLLRDFPPMVPMKDKQGMLKKYNKKGRIFSTGQIIQAQGHKGSLRGALVLNKRPDYIFVDDPEKEDVIKSPTMRENFRRTFFQGIEFMGSLSEETNIYVTDTEKHFDSLASNLRKWDDWESHIFSALDENDIILWPDLFCKDVEDLEQWEIDNYHLKGSKRTKNKFVQVGNELKSVKSIRAPFYGILERPGRKPIIGLGSKGGERSEIFEQEFLSRPMSLDDQPLRRDNWRTYALDDKLIASLDDKVFMLDNSLGNEKSDFQAGTVVGRKGRDYYLLGAFLERIPLVERRESTGEVIHIQDRVTLSEVVATYCKKYDIRSIYMEDNSMQALYLPTLLSDVESSYRNDSRWHDYCKDKKLNIESTIPSIYGFKSTTKKEDRIKFHLGLLMQAGRIHIREDWRKAYKAYADTLNEWPQTRHDDAPDCFDMAIRVLEERYDD